MTAHIGHPTLRLIRYAIGDWTLDALAPGRAAPCPPPNWHRRHGQLPHKGKRGHPPSRKGQAATAHRERLAVHSIRAKSSHPAKDGAAARASHAPVIAAAGAPPPVARPAASRRNNTSKPFGQRVVI